MNQQFVKLVTSKKMVSKSSDSEPVFMSDEFAYNRSNQGTKIMRDTQLENKRRTVLAHAEGGPYKVFERVLDKGEKSNRVYNVSENSIKEFVAPSLFSMSNRKEIKKCGSRNTKRNNNKKQSDNNKKSVNNKKNKGNNGNKIVLKNNKLNNNSNKVVLKNNKSVPKKVAKKPTKKVVKKPTKKVAKKPAKKSLKKKINKAIRKIVKSLTKK